MINMTYARSLLEACIVAADAVGMRNPACMGTAVAGRAAELGERFGLQHPRGSRETGVAAAPFAERSIRK